MNNQSKTMNYGSTPLDLVEVAADAAPAPTADDKLARAVQLGELMREQERSVTTAELALTEAKASYRRTQEEDLPELLKEIGLQMFKLEDGGSVELKEDLTCAITEANKPEAHAWLIAQQFGGLIKTQVIVDFERGDLKKAVKFYAKVRKQLPDNGVTVKDGVHPQTLKAFVREQLEKPGNNFPLEMFSVRPFDKAVYKPAAPVKRSRAS